MSLFELAMGLVIAVCGFWLMCLPVCIYHIAQGMTGLPEVAEVVD